MKFFTLLLTLFTLPAMANQPTLYGRYEHIRLPQIGKTLEAKMDTGAMTASLSARDIEQFERNGEPWVRFRLATATADDTLFEQPMTRISTIKARTEELSSDAATPVTERPVIELEVCLGEAARVIEVNLTDRSHFDYPLLIGATALRDFEAAIDPSERYTAANPQC
ncbi:retropepsin-like aspartic peptidase RloA2 [Pseudomonas borbori]